MSDVFHRLDEIAAALPADQWMLVGGLMVHAHARLSAVRYSRPTDDADLVVELRATTYPMAARIIESLGYTPHETLDPQAPFHRFVRGSDVVDLMAPEGRHTRFVGRSVISVPGARSALGRTVCFTTPGESAIRLPDLGSALSLKGAALSTSSPNGVRHLQDSVLLFACADGRALDLSKSMRANINRAIRSLDTPSAWSYADLATRRKAVRAILATQPAWSVPEFVLTRRARPGR